MCVDYTDLNKHCPKDPSGCRRLIKSSTPRRAATCSASSTATPGTTRSRFVKYASHMLLDKGDALLNKSVSNLVEHRRPVTRKTRL
jgi:hypothetical protein